MGSSRDTWLCILPLPLAWWVTGVSSSSSLVLWGDIVERENGKVDSCLFQASSTRLKLQMDVSSVSTNFWPSHTSI